MNTQRIQNRLDATLALLAVIGALCEMAVDEVTSLSKEIHGGKDNGTHQRSPKKGH